MDDYRKLIEDIIFESTVSGGYPNDGSTGPASDDDGAPGTTVFGDKMVPVEVPNRLTGKTIKYVPAEDLGQKWNYDEFENSKSMGSHKTYSQTLNKLDDLVNNRQWKHTDRRKFRLAKSKHLLRKANDIDQTSKLGDDKEETMDITEKINIYLNEDEVERIDEKIVDTNDRKEISKAIMSGRTTKLKIKSLGIDAVVRNDGEEVTIVYPKNEDFTLSLVDISDALGYKFDMEKHGNKQHFVIYID